MQFTISPKPGSVTRPVSATYTIEYLQDRGYLDTSTGEATLPIFGLYADYSNTVTLTYNFVNGTSLQNTVNVPTHPLPTHVDSIHPTVVQARTNTTDLSYDYHAFKNALRRPLACS